MKLVATILLVLASSSVNNFVEALTPTNVRCSGATIHKVSIPNCNQQPCTVRKGQRVPFEVSMSLKQPGISASHVNLNVFISYYGPPPGYYGSSLALASCDNGKLGFKCPVTSNKRYNLKSTLFIDPKSVCTAGCNTMKKDGTGIRDTTWNLQMSKERKNGSPSYVCSFNVKLNIVA